MSTAVLYPPTQRIRYLDPEQAACRDADPNLFYSPEGERGDERRARDSRAVQVCLSCSQLEPCRAEAFANDEHYGVWGGTTERDRDRWRRKGRPA